VSQLLDRLFQAAGRTTPLYRVIAVALLLALPAIFTGYLLDDHLQRLMALGTPTPLGLERAPWDLFTFFANNPEQNRRYVEVLGAGPWWAEPTLHLSFGRPISSLLAWFDYAVAGWGPMMSHLHSLAWFAGCIAAAALLYRSLFGATAAAALALWCFALDDAHAMPIAWLANRNALVSALFGILAFAALVKHTRPEADGGGITPRGWALALAGFALGLAGGEVALACAAYFVAWIWFAAGGSLRTRLTGVAVWVAAVVAWRLIYNAAGFGTAGTGLYIDPGQDPLLFAGALLSHPPVLLLGQLLPLPAELWLFAPPAITLTWSALGWLAFALLALPLWRLVRGDRIAVALLVGALLATIPMAAGIPHDRMLLVPGLGFFGVLARLATRPEASPRLMRYIVVVHLILAAAALPLRAASQSAISAHIDAARDTLPDAATRPGNLLVTLHAIDMFQASYITAWRLAEGLPAPERTVLAGIGLKTVTVTRRDDHTLLLQQQGGYLSQRFDWLARHPSHRFTAGETHRLPGALLTVETLTADARPDRIALRLDLPIDDPHHLFVWAGLNGFVQVAPPAAGSSLLIDPLP
jgi:hypothetical protein